MIVRQGKGTTEFGPGIEIELSGDEIALAISAYLVTNDINISGARTITVNGELCEIGSIYVDPSGVVVFGKNKNIEPDTPEELTQYELHKLIELVFTHKHGGQWGALLGKLGRMKDGTPTKDGGIDGAYRTYIDNVVKAVAATTYDEVELPESKEGEQ